MLLNSFLPTELYSFLLEIEELGFSLCLVGGAVRDYLMLGIVSRDLDFEIRSNQKISDKDWPTYYERLIKFLESRKEKILLFPYMITKVDFMGWSVEFSSPRQEIYANLEMHSHHNFSAALSSNISYDESFKRRDFTFNAMGFELSFKNNTMTLVDPFGGEKDLAEKKLKAIDSDFFKDSVRFLRLIRFKIKYQMTIDPNIENFIGAFNLSALSKYHFTSELFKADAGSFLNLWRVFVAQFNLVPPKDFQVWSDTAFDWPINKLHTKEDLLIYAFLIKPESAQKIQNFFSMPEKTLRDLNSFYSALMHLKVLNKKNAKQLLEQKTKELVNQELFQSMKVLDEKKEWRQKIHKFVPDIEKDLVFEWQNWENEKTTEEEITMCDPMLRSYLKYYKALKRWLSDD